MTNNYIVHIRTEHAQYGSVPVLSMASGYLLTLMNVCRFSRRDKF